MTGNLNKLRLVLLISAGAPLHAQPLNFAAELYPVFEKVQCRLCHNDNGVASRTRLEFPPDGAAAQDIQSFGTRLARLVDRAEPEQSLLLLKPTNRVPHTGGERIAPGSPEEKLLKSWIDYLAKLPESAWNQQTERPGAHPFLVRRLTHSQYNHTVRDLLGDQTRFSDQFPKEDFVHGFLNQAEGQGISPLQAEAYNRAAEKLSRNALRGGDRHGLIPCQPSSANDIECRDRFVREFGRRAFRRPLSAKEAGRYSGLFDLEARRTGDFVGGARIVVEAMLQSPNFLFYSNQIASRLSYFLWDTMPDEELLRAAEAGELATRDGIEKAVRRMLEDERAKLAMDEFLGQWLRFDRVRNAVRERRLYPEFSVELLESMLEETRQLFRHLVWGNRSFLEFFTAEYSFLDTNLAKLYGLAPPAEQFGLVRFPGGSERAGFLGQATFLTATSKPADTSPTERGLFIREHFLCQIVPPPPPGVNTTLPPVTDDKPMGNRERLAVHLNNEACAGCHRLVDSIGFGFERYDALGRFRDAELIRIYPTADELKTKRKTKPTEYKLPIETKAVITGIPGAEFSSPQEAGHILANDAGCRKCVVKQLFRYAMGRPETSADQQAIDAILDRFRDSHFRFQDLIIAIVTSEPFLAGGS